MGNSAVNFLTPAEMEVQREIDAEELDAKNAQTEGKEETEPDPPATGDDTTKVEDPPKTEDAAATATAEEAARQEQQRQVPIGHVPVMVADPPPEDFDARMAAFATQKDELDAKFDASELTSNEYRKQLEAITRQEMELQRQKDEYEFAERNNAENAKLVWRAQVDTYASQHKELGSAAGRAAWNAELQGLLKDKEAADGKPMHWFLSEAHKRMRETLGIGTSKEEAEKITAEADAIVKKAPPKRTTPAAPTTLHDAPRAGAVDTGQDEFAKIDAMEGIEQEAAVAALERRDPHAYRRWLEGR